MKILTGNQIKEADLYTIEHEPIDSLSLMERAAEVVAQAVCGRIEQGSDLLFFIGKGNNGGDGLAVARMLANVGFRCSAFIPYEADELSEDCLYNYERLPDSVRIVGYGNFEVSEDTIIIDALLGTGVKGEVKERELSVINMINELGLEVISIDLPSGMKTEFGNDPKKIVRADTTFTLEFPKLAMLLPEAGECAGKIEVLPIELCQEYIYNAPDLYNYIDAELINNFTKARLKFSHKGDYGHALLVCGAKGMCGAAILATGAALRSGCGLVTIHMPEKETVALYANAPSAMISPDKADFFSALPANMEKFTSIGIGCGIGQDEHTVTALERLLRATTNPMVIDADALNIIADNPRLKKLIPDNSILTPHSGEFKRIVGEWSTEADKLELMKQLARELNSIIVLKGAHTAICTPELNLYFNSSGCPGMAKGGSGDVLTGFMTGLLARGYTPDEAAILGVYIHGRAGEKAAEYFGEEGMNSGDLIDFLAEAFLEVR